MQERDQGPRLRHLLHYVLAPIMLQGALCVAAATVIETGWHVAGLGMARPAAVWDGMMREGWLFMGTAPWISAFPAMGTILTAIGLYLLRGGAVPSPAPVRQSPRCFRRGRTVNVLSEGGLLSAISHMMAYVTLPASTAPA